MSMIKRNDGYALSYVLVILLVLSVIAISTLSAPLRNLQTQQASIERMQEKYAAQGLIEQAAATMQLATSELELKQMITTDDTQPYKIEGFAPAVNGNLTATITATYHQTTVEAAVELIPIPGQNEETVGYTVSYLSYRMVVAS